jgi:hypothetical protein
MARREYILELDELHVDFPLEGIETDTFSSVLAAQRMAGHFVRNLEFVPQGEKILLYKRGGETQVGEIFPAD